MSLLRRSTEPVSPLRTRGGARPSLAEWATLPGALLRRLARVEADHPWLAPAAVTFLDGTLRSDDVLLELGGGASTAWFAQRVGQVWTIESNPEWADRIEALTSGIGNVTVARCTVRDGLGGDAPAPTVVLVDHEVRGGEVTRPEAVEWAMALDPTPRMVILDDSDRPDYQAALAAPVERSVFRGFRPYALYLTETTILFPS